LASFKRVGGEDFAVVPAASSRALHGPFRRYIENSAITFVAFIAGHGVNVLSSAQEVNKKVIWPEPIGLSLVLLIVFAVWAGFWSFFNRLVVHSFRSMTNLAISGIASIVFLMLLTAAGYFEFIFSAPTATEIARFAGFAVIFSLLLYNHLSVMSELFGWKRIVSSALIRVGPVGVVLLINDTHWKEFSNELRFSSVMKPVGRKMGRDSVL